ncbi:sal3, partial [Symbiodinium pilosum]
YQQAKQAEPDNLIIGMMAVLGSADVPEGVRRHDCVLLRQLVTRGAEKDFVYARISDAHKREVATELLRQYEQEKTPSIQKKIGEVISKLADYVCDTDDPRASLGAPSGWPALLPQVFRMANTSTALSVESCESALRLLKDCVPTLKDQIVAAKQELGQIIQNGLASPQVKHKVATFLLVCEIVTETEKKAWAPLLSTVSVLVQVLTALAQAKEEELLQECIQAFTDVATVEPDFFKAQLQQTMEPAKFMATVARTREIDSGLRGLAIEWLVSFVEKRAKFLSKSAPDFINLTLECCMSLMLEVDESEDKLKEWIERMDDEEGEEDEDELFHTGEECIDRVAEAATMEAIGPGLFRLIAHFAAQESWQAKHAALAAVKQTVEYVEEEHVDEMAKLLLGHVDHPHPRVRFTALHGLGQLANDQSPHFQEKSHQQVMPVLTRKMDDQVDRVAAMAMSAFVSFGEELDNSLMHGYARPLMEKLVMKLQGSQHRGVREEAITSIAVIAGVMEQDFVQYYDSIMPMLKQFVMTATSKKENRLRGKSFECMSLLGIAVGKEKFLNDAREAIGAMMNTQVEADDVQREYIKEASERICTCLKKDFKPFLQPLLPGIFRNLRFDDLNEQAPASGGADDDDYIKVSTGDGKTVRVHSEKFQDMMQSVQLLHTFVTEMESGYFEAIPDTAQVLLPLLSATDDSSMLCEEVRGTALQVWALLIKSAKLGAQERGQDNVMAKELLQKGLEAAFQQLQQYQDAEVLQELSSGVAECIKNVGPGVLGSDEVQKLTGSVFTLMDQSLQRSHKHASEQAKEKHEASALPQELHAGDEDEDEHDLTAEEDQLRRNYEEILGAMMKVSPEQFLPCLSGCAQRIQQWVATKENKVLGLYLVCDLLDHLKEHSESAWPIFMPKIFESIHDEDADARTAAAYAVNLAAPLAKFAEATPEAFKRLAVVVGKPKPKKRDEKAKVAMDNAVAAMLSLLKDKGQLCPPDIQAWDLVLAKLPLRDDCEEVLRS